MNTKSGDNITINNYNVFNDPNRNNKICHTCYENGYTGAYEAGWNPSDRDAKHLYSYTLGWIDSKDGKRRRNLNDEKELPISDPQINDYYYSKGQRDMDWDPPLPVSPYNHYYISYLAGWRDAIPEEEPKSFFERIFG